MVAEYLYAIVPAERELVFDVAGVDDDRDEVRSISYHDIGAVVSASPLKDYRGLKRDQAVRYLVAHQRVVEAVMQELPILPVKFGTVLPDEAWVWRLLEQGEALLRSALDRFVNLVQVEVVVLWNSQEVFQEIGQEEVIAQLKAQLAGRSPEQTLAERVAIGQMVQASLQRRRAALGERLLPPLREVALDMAVNALMDDSMVLNVALLLDRAGQQALDERLQTLDEAFEGRLRFRRVGPLPPYSFSTVEVRVPSFEEVDKARRCLGLGEAATTNEIKRAYHRLAGQAHPDHNPDDPEAEARMTELAQAYRLLTTYAEQASKGDGEAGRWGDREHPLTPSPHHPITFCREAVEQTLLIAVRRQELLY